jgi:ABC-2 type transport system ATP-binding protein
MRQRNRLAQALLSDPDILILDEPTTGLDPLARHEIRDILVGLRDAGKTLLISSHELSEVELISNRVGILYQGELQVCGTLNELLTERDLTIEAEALSAESSANITAAGIAVEEGQEGMVLLRVPSTKTVYEAMELCQQEKVVVTTVAPRRETLEELFVRTVGSARQK